MNTLNNKPKSKLCEFGERNNVSKVYELNRLEGYLNFFKGANFGLVEIHSVSY